MKVYGIIGYPVEHSRSPELHNTWFKKAGIDAIYKKFPVAPEDLADFMKNFKKKLSGASVTIPHKIAIMQYLDEIDPAAKKIGAVNTIVNQGGRLIGYNTDVYGAMKALSEETAKNQQRGDSGDFFFGALRQKGNSARVPAERKNITEDFSLTGKRIVLLGAGGAAHAIAYGLMEAGADTTILDQDFEKAQALAQKMHARAKKMESLNETLKNANIIINATPIGMEPNEDQSVIPKELLCPHMTVFDIVYKPLKTKLLLDAEKAGCKTITGDKMLLYQAKKQFELWTK